MTKSSPWQPATTATHTVFTAILAAPLGFRPDACQAILEKYNLEVKRQLNYATNAYFVGAPEGTGLDIFRIAQVVLEDIFTQLLDQQIAIFLEDA